MGIIVPIDRIVDRGPKVDKMVLYIGKHDINIKYSFHDYVQ